MTISDEPDEDADSLDDEGLMESFIRPVSPARTAQAHSSARSNDVCMNDWPLSKLEAAAEPGAIAWFKANHADWKGQMESVLRGWILSQLQINGLEAETSSPKLISYVGPQKIESE